MTDDPKIKAIELYNQGAHLINSKDASPDNQQLAYRLFSSSVDCDPSLAEAWLSLGDANGNLGCDEAAVTCWRKAVALQSEDGAAWTALGHRLYHMGRIKEAREATLRAISLCPEVGSPYCNLSLIEGVDGRMAAAVKAARKGYELTPDPTMELGLAFALMFSGEYAEGLKHFESRFPHKLKQYLDYPYPKWEGEDISSKTLFVMSEMGMGDTISFLRFVPAVAARAGHIKLHVHPELLRLVRVMFAHLFNVECIPLPAPFSPADVWTSITSIPTALGLTTEEIIAAKNIGIPEFPRFPNWKRPSACLHVGVAWQGAKANDVDRWRSFPVETLFQFATIPGVQLYSIQVGEGSADMHSKGSASFIRDLSPYLRDVGDTLSIMQDLDVIVTCESAVRHIAGLIGKTCLVPYGYNGGDWRCGRSQKHPLWDENTTLFRQTADATWEKPFRDIGKVLERMAKEKG